MGVFRSVRRVRSWRVRWWGAFCALVTLAVVGTLMGGCSSTAQASPSVRPPSVPSPSAPSSSASPPGPAVASGPSSQPGLTSAPPPRTSAPTPGPCRGDQLKVNLKFLPGAAMGNTYSNVVLTDKSAIACWVQGSVTLMVTDAEHHTIPIQVVMPSAPATVVTLEPGGSAAQLVHYSSDGNPASGSRDCAPAEAFFEITVPGADTPVSVPASGRGHCPHDRILLSNLVAGAYVQP